MKHFLSLTISLFSMFNGQTQYCEDYVKQSGVFIQPGIGLKAEGSMLQVKAGYNYSISRRIDVDIAGTWLPPVDRNGVKYMGATVGIAYKFIRNCFQFHPYAGIASITQMKEIKYSSLTSIAGAEVLYNFPVMPTMFVKAIAAYVDVNKLGRTSMVHIGFRITFGKMNY